MQETYGLITYQEQFLLDCKTFAGWSIAYADKHVRKNKHIKEDSKLKYEFIEDTIMNGYTKDIAEQVWQEIEDAVSGGYSFNNNHERRPMGNVQRLAERRTPKQVETGNIEDIV